MKEIVMAGIFISEKWSIEYGHILQISILTFQRGFQSQALLSTANLR